MARMERIDSAWEISRPHCIYSMLIGLFQRFEFEKAALNFSRWLQRESQILEMGQTPKRILRLQFFQMLLSIFQVFVFVNRHYFFDSCNFSIKYATSA